MAQVISLIGYRGVGKSSVARCLALELGWDWRDADVELELQAGKSIAAIFADDGEPAFRDWESRVLAELAGRERLVLAAGGGAVLRDVNRRVLRSAGRVVWLRAEPETLVARIAADATTAARRPSLTNLGTEAEVRRLLAERAPLYEACADLVVETEGRTPVEIARQIADWARSSDEDRS